MKKYGLPLYLFTFIRRMPVKTYFGGFVVMKKLTIWPGIFALLMFVLFNACDNGGNGGTRLVGIVTITGTAQEGETLAADITGLAGTGTPSFQWNIAGGGSAGTASTLLLTEAHVGQRLTVTVTRAGYSGSVTSALTPEVTAEDAPPPPPWPPVMTFNPETVDAGLMRFHNANIGITFSETPPGARILYTTDGSHPTTSNTAAEVTGALSLPVASAPPGIVRLRWMTEGHSPAALPFDQMFQIFPAAPFPGHSGTDTVIGEFGYIYEGDARTITVELTVINGRIQTAVVTSTYDPNSDDGKSEEFVLPAIEQATQFLEVMNSTALNIDALSTATYTMTAIMQAAQNAIDDL